MARPQKEGLDYFPHDTDAANDEKIEALRALYGNDGYAVYFILLERIYRANTFELPVSDAETRQILARKCAVTVERFEQIVASAIKYGCFDRDAYEERGVLTSHGIKKRAGVVVEKRLAMRERYRAQAETAASVSDAETTQETGVETQQSKVKESITTTTTTAPLPPNQDDAPPPDDDPVLDIPDYERTVLSVLKGIKGYPFDLRTDLKLVQDLIAEYPTVDILAEARAYAKRKLDDPLTHKSKPRSQFSNWCKKALDFQRERAARGASSRASPARGRESPAERRLRELGVTA